MKKALSRLFLLSSTIFILSCNSSSNKTDTNTNVTASESDNSKNEKTTKKVKISESAEIYDLVSKLPSYGQNARITFPKNDFISVKVEVDGKTETFTELNNVPDNYLSKQTRKIKSIEGGYLSENRSLSELKSDMAQNKDDDYFADGLEISFMLNIDLNEKYTTILSLKTETKNGEPQNDEWVLYSINTEGEFISEMIRFDDIIVHGNQILSTWFYASDPYPMYELWQLNQDGIFEMVSSEKNPPSWFKK